MNKKQITNIPSAKDLKSETSLPFAMNEKQKDSFLAVFGKCTLEHHFNINDHLVSLTLIHRVLYIPCQNMILI